MSSYHYQHNELFIEEVALKTIADTFGTPCYVYSTRAIVDNFQAYHQALAHIPHRVGYAVKANSNLSILQLLSQCGANFDIVSLGELERVITAGGDPKKIIFSGVGKQSIEIERALELGIHCFNVESSAELQRLHQIAQHKNIIAPIALRVNPNIDAGTHPYIATGLHENKFGIEFSEAQTLLKTLSSLPHLKLIGITCHIGSQITTLSPFLESIDKVFEFIHHNQLSLEHINIGGGLGIRYHDETPPSIAEYVTAIKHKFEHRAEELILEPGRAIIANAGLLLMRVEYLKETPYKNFAVVDAAMNDFMRPSLYNAWQKIIPLSKAQHTIEKVFDIVGPVCESGDFLGKNRMLSLTAGDYLALCDAGAYGFCMSSNYNSRPRAPEVLIDGHNIRLIRQRETIQDLLALENFTH